MCALLPDPDTIVAPDYAADVSTNCTVPTLPAGRYNVSLVIPGTGGWGNAMYDSHLYTGTQGDWIYVASRLACFYLFRRE